jgi:hypothetical protein
VKPLYTGLVYLGYKARIPLIQATLVPSFITYLLIGLLLFYWLSIYLRPSITFLISLLIMISSPMIEVAKLATPDCLSAFLLLSAFYFVLEKPSLLLAALLMALSIFARLDNIIACLITFGIVYFSKKWDQKISFKNFSLIISLFIGCYLLIGLIAYRYGWSIFYYNDFAGHLHQSYGSNEDFSLKSYLRLMYEHVLSGINRSYLTVFLVLLFFNFMEPKQVKKLSFDKLFLLFILVILLIRLILYPDVSDRFYIPFYLVTTILTAKRFSLIQITSV